MPHAFVNHGTGRGCAHLVADPDREWVPCMKPIEDHPPVAATYDCDNCGQAVPKEEIRPVSVGDGMEGDLCRKCRGGQPEEGA